MQPLYDWTVNGTPVGVGATWTVSSVQASVGDSIVCTATAQDSQMLSASATASVILSNSNPVVSSVQISCANGAFNDQVCECTANVSDPDEVVTPTYEWVDANGSVGSMALLDLATTALMPGDVLECIVTVIDAVGSQDQSTDTITLDNRPPNAPSVSITQPIRLL